MEGQKPTAFCLCLIVLIGAVYGSSVSRRAPSFTLSPSDVIVKSNSIEEASGLAASRKHPGILYTHNDHGGTPGIFMVSATSGHREATLDLHGVDENDIEDIAVGRCREGSHDYCIYVADTGNGGHGAVNKIYRIPEPDLVDNQEIYVDSSNILQFSWSEPDCETLLVDPNAIVYLISKVAGGRGAIAHVPNSAWGTGSRVTLSTTARLNVKSDHRDPVGGDISPDGEEILIKTHEAIFYWSAHGSRDYLSLLTLSPGVPVPYTIEHQGEAVCWDATGHGYYTLGEGDNERLYHYIRQ